MKRMKREYFIVALVAISSASAFSFHGVSSLRAVTSTFTRIGDPLRAESGDDTSDTSGGDVSVKEDKSVEEKPRPAPRPGVNGPVRLASPSRVDDYVSPVNFEKGVTKGPGPLSPRWSDSGRWEKEQDKQAESTQSEGEQQFLLKEKYGTYFRVPNAATLMTSK